MGRAEPLLLEIEGMFCTSCSRAVERVLSRIDGVAEARVGFATRVASLVLEPGADEEAVRSEAIATSTELGYPARPWVFKPAGLAEDDDGTTELGLRIAIGWFLGMWVMLAQLAQYMEPGAPLEQQLVLARIAAVFATPVVFVVGARFHLAGWRTLKAGIPGMDLLVSLGATGAWTLSMLELWRGSPEVWFDASTMLVVLLLAGRLLEARARKQGVDAVRELLDLTPETVLLRTEAGAVEVVAATVEPGQVVLVEAGARIPLDGTIICGRSSVDRSPLTGESEALGVEPGTAVQAGCTNGPGPLEVEVTAGVGERALDRIAVQVRQALDQRAEVPGLAQRLSERAVPVILGLAGLTLLVTAWWTGSPQVALLRALTVLVVTCPCALGMAAPLVRVVAIGRAAKEGVLFRDADALERTGEVHLVVFDKTGTLTRGRPRLVGIEPEGIGAEALRRFAASAELGSAHPLGRALRAGLSGLEDDGEREVVPGRGVIWHRAGQVVRVGSRAWFAGLPKAHPWATEVWVEVDGKRRGRLLLEDEVRPDAAETVRSLAEQGYALALWSGDGPGPVAHLAAQVGLPLEACRSRMTPLDKAAAVLEREARGGRVVFVGDGINDAPALAAATVGIAVQEATDAARAAAGVVVRAPGLGRIDRLLAIAREARARAKTNVAWALTYNALAVPLAMAGWIRPELAALAMVLSSISVTLNATRPLGTRPTSTWRPAVVIAPR